jgi:hypothetical protein
MSNEKGPPIEMTPERIGCQRHLEHFRARWPVGYVQFGLLLMEAIWRNPDALAEARETEGVGPKSKPSPKTIEKVLDKTPACCRVSQLDLLRAYTKCRVGILGRCECCGNKKLGTPYTTVVQKIDHLCFTCSMESYVSLVN